MAEMPVVVSMWSMETVKAVSWLSVFSATIGGRPSRLATSALMGVQIRPLALDAIKFMFSWVANSAAQIMSPSFSRSGSSVTRMIFPALRSSRASSMVLYSYFFSSIVPPVIFMQRLGARCSARPAQARLCSMSSVMPPSRRMLPPSGWSCPPGPMPSSFSVYLAMMSVSRLTVSPSLLESRVVSSPV